MLQVTVRFSTIQNRREMKGLFCSLSELRFYKLPHECSLYVPYPSTKAENGRRAARIYEQWPDTLMLRPSSLIAPERLLLFGRVLHNSSSIGNNAIDNMQALIMRFRSSPLPPDVSAGQDMYSFIRSCLDIVFAPEHSINLREEVCSCRNCIWVAGGLVIVL